MFLRNPMKNRSKQKQKRLLRLLQASAQRCDLDPANRMESGVGDKLAFECVLQFNTKLLITD
jgi:hypothetical protein